jgi:hypothetical protein
VLLELVLSSSEAKAYLIEIDAVEPLGHVARLLNDAVAAGICLLLAFGALAFGGVQEWAMCVLEIGAALLVTVWVVRELVNDRLEILSNPLSVPVFLFAGLVAIQLLLHRTAYWYVTWQKALLWAAYAMLGFLTAQCFRDRVSLKRLSIFLGVFGYLVAFARNRTGVCGERQDLLGGAGSKWFWFFRALFESRTLRWFDGDAGSISACARDGWFIADPDAGTLFLRGCDHEQHNLSVEVPGRYRSVRGGIRCAGDPVGTRASHAPSSGVIGVVLPASALLSYAIAPQRLVGKVNATSGSPG